MYQLMQLSPSALKEKMKQTADQKEKRRCLKAMIYRSILLILFAILYISLFTTLFGKENSSVAVGSFCILLGTRFVSYGYNVKESLVAMGVVFALMFFSGLVQLLDNPFLSVVVHFFCILLILILTADEPIMGNAGLYLFSYLFISMTPVSEKRIFFRFISLLFVFLWCGSILYRKHKEKNQDVYLKHIFQRFKLTNKKSLWQIRLALGISTGLFIGQLLGLSKVVWVGYSCMSVLLPHQGTLHHRTLQRIGGVALGSFLFAFFSSIIPDKLTFLFGPLAGLCIGFTATYFWTNVLNCFGALLLASSLYGIGPSVLFRIEDNILGALYAFLIFLLFEGILQKMWEEKIDA